MSHMTYKSVKMVFEPTLDLTNLGGVVEGYNTDEWIQENPCIQQLTRYLYLVSFPTLQIYCIQNWTSEFTLPSFFLVFPISGNGNTIHSSQYQ